MLEQIKFVMDSQEVNWQTVLSFLSTAVVCVPQFSDLVQGNHLTEKIDYFLLELNLSKPDKVGFSRVEEIQLSYTLCSQHKQYVALYKL